MDFLSADSLPWLSETQQRLRDARLTQRLPHSSLLLSKPGLGAEVNPDVAKAHLATGESWWG